MCENDSSCSLTLVSSWSTLSQLMNPGESWHCRPGICPSHLGRKNRINGITWSFSTFRNCWFAVPRPDQLKYNTTICGFKSKWRLFLEGQRSLRLTEAIWVRLPRSHPHVRRILRHLSLENRCIAHICVIETPCTYLVSNGSGF